MNLKYIMSAILILFTCSIFNVQASEVIEFKDAKATKRVEPKYPIEAARAGKNGWVLLSFVIEKDGSVSSPIVEDSSGYRGFEKEAKRAIKKWKFEPATENGKAVQQCQYSVQLDFMMNSSEAVDSVSRKFKSKYEDALELLKSKNVEGLEQQLVNLEDSANYHSERMRLALINGHYAELINNSKLQRKSYLRALSEGDRFLDVDYKINLLEQIFLFDLQFNYLNAAKIHAESIIELTEDEKIKAKYQDYLDKIDNFIQSHKKIVVKADMGSKDSWHIKLLRNEFTVSNVKGKLYSLDIRCNNKRQVFNYKKGNAWKIPAAWDQCSVYVKGDDNTTFTLVEYPFVQDKQDNLTATE